MTNTSADRVVGGPAAWTAAELDEIDAALAHARVAAPGLDLARLGADDFPLPTVSALVDAIRRQLVDGKGLMVCAGFPVDRYTLAELRAIWWCLSQHVGTPVAQSWRGDVLGDVRDLGTGIEGRAGRGYTSNVELDADGGIGAVEHLDGLGERLRADVGDGDLAPLGEQRPGEAEADAVGAAGDEGGAAREILHVDTSGGAVSKRRRPSRLR